MYYVWESVPYEGYEYAEFSTWEEAIRHIEQIVGKSKRNRKQFEDWKAGVIDSLFIGSSEILITSTALTRPL